MLQAPPVGAEWWAYLTAAIKGSFFVPNMSDEEEIAWASSYRLVLGAIPAPILNEALKRVLSRGGNMRPTPGDLKVEANRIIADARERLRAPPPRPHAPERERREPVRTEEGAAEIAKLVERLNRRVGASRRMPVETRERGKPVPPLIPRPMTDGQIMDLRGLELREHVRAFRESNGVSSPADVRAAREWIRGRQKSDQRATSTRARDGAET